MALVIDREDAQGSLPSVVAPIPTPVARRPIAVRLEHLFFGETSILRLALITGVPIVAGAWLLLSPARVVSREMTADLLFALSGAWRIHDGQVPHVDFHDPVGALTFVLTYLGFFVTGPTPRAFLFGEAIFLLFTFAAAVVAASRRLSPVLAAIFVLDMALLVLLPTNIGDQPNAYSFATAYNRWGWSALTTMCLILFLPPRETRRARWIDQTTVAALLVATFYTKITFAAAGAAAVLFALATSKHANRRWRTWSAALALSLSICLLPHARAYLTDIWQAANAGYVRAELMDHIRSFLANREEYALYGGGVLILLWLWRRRQVPLQFVAAAAFTLCIGLFVLSQNHQDRRLPIGIVIACLLYEVVRNDRRGERALRTADVVLPVAAILVLPLLSLAAATAALVGYHRAAERGTAVLTVDATNLRGLTVPSDDVEIAGAWTASSVPYQRFSPDRPLQEGLTQSQYVRVFLEAASWFADGRHGTPKILALDTVNPLPFMLGYPSPRGGNLWVWSGAPKRPPADVFGDVDYVLVPKFASEAASAVAQYDSYLSKNFPIHEETENWTILHRSTRVLAR
jgi:hypothetical protein